MVVDAVVVLIGLVPATSLDRDRICEPSLRTRVGD